MSGTSSPTTTSGGNSSVFSYVLGGLGLIIGLFLFVVAITAFFGQIGASQFSPDSFSRRNYTYYQIPLTGIQVTPTTVLTSSSDLESYLGAQNLIPTSSSASPRWDLVQDRSSLSGEPLGPAAILTTLLDIHHSNADALWLKWSKDNPNEAKIFWPLVVELAREGWYHALPDLFDFAQTAPKDAPFQKELEKIVAARYFTEGELLRKVGKSAEAKKCFDRCLQLDPQHTEAEKQRKELPAEANP